MLSGEASQDELIASLKVMWQESWRRALRKTYCLELAYGNKQPHYLKHVGKTCYQPLVNFRKTWEKNRKLRESPENWRKTLDTPGKLGKIWRKNFRKTCRTWGKLGQSEGKPQKFGTNLRKTRKIKKRKIKIGGKWGENVKTSKTRIIRGKLWFLFPIKSLICNVISI